MWLPSSQIQLPHCYSSIARQRTVYYFMPLFTLFDKLIITSADRMRRDRWDELPRSPARMSHHWDTVVMTQGWQCAGVMLLMCDSEKSKFPFSAAKIFHHPPPFSPKYGYVWSWKLSLLMEILGFWEDSYAWLKDREKVGDWFCFRFGYFFKAGKI